MIKKGVLNDEYPNLNKKIILYESLERKWEVVKGQKANFARKNIKSLIILGLKKSTNQENIEDWKNFKEQT